MISQSAMWKKNQFVVNTYGEFGQIPCPDFAELVDEPVGNDLGNTYNSRSVLKNISHPKFTQLSEKVKKKSKLIIKLFPNLFLQER